MSHDKSRWKAKMPHHHQNHDKDLEELNPKRMYHHQFPHPYFRCNETGNNENSTQSCNIQFYRYSMAKFGDWGWPGFYRILSKAQKSFWSCSHMNCCLRNILYINLHIPYIIHIKTSSKIQESRKSNKYIKSYQQNKFEFLIF